MAKKASHEAWPLQPAADEAHPVDTGDESSEPSLVRGKLMQVGASLTVLCVSLLLALFVRHPRIVSVFLFSLIMVMLFLFILYHHAMPSENGIGYHLVALVWFYWVLYGGLYTFAFFATPSSSASAGAWNIFELVIGVGQIALVIASFADPMWSLAWMSHAIVSCSIALDVFPSRENNLFQEHLFFSILRILSFFLVYFLVDYRNHQLQCEPMPFFLHRIFLQTHYLLFVRFVLSFPFFVAHVLLISWIIYRNTAPPMPDVEEAPPPKKKRKKKRADPDPVSRKGHA